MSALVYDFSIDAFAVSNPAFCAIVLANFCNGFERSGQLAEFPLIFLPLPIVLSATNRESFKGTNASTGFYAWTDRNPELLAGLPGEVKAVRSIARDALLLGFTANLLKLDQDGRVGSFLKLSTTKTKELGKENEKALKFAERLGVWMGEVGSAHAVFYGLGIKP
jgi:hypothetical protein